MIASRLTRDDTPSRKNGRLLAAAVYECEDVTSSLYPGYAADAGFGQVIVGTLYGLVDGAVAGAVLAWLYNCFARV